MPKQILEFLLKTLLDSLNLYRFAKFWLVLMVFEYTRSWQLTGGMHDASFLIVLNYLELGKVQEARTLRLMYLSFLNVW